MSKYYDSLFIQYYIYNPRLYIFFQNIFKFWRNPLEVQHKYQMQKHTNLILKLVICTQCVGYSSTYWLLKNQHLQSENF